MSFVFGANSASTGYNLTRSLRFRASATAYLSRTPASASNRKTFTLSTWVKRGALGARQSIFDAYAASAGNSLEFQTSDILEFYAWGGASVFDLATTQVFRDPSAWYHIVVAVDTTQATAANRIKLYINGTQVTAFGTATYPSLNADLYINNNIVHNIGRRGDAQFYFDGYLAEDNFVDGQQLTPSSFGSTNALTGVWQPAAYTGTYGTNGFELNFTDNSALTTSSNVGLGKDFSGNGNYWTTNNISITAGVTYDSMTDVPTLTSATAANFPTLNPLNSIGSSDISAGNLTRAGGNNYTISTMGMPSGKWYAEMTVTTVGTESSCGIATAADVGGSGVGNNAFSWGYFNNGNKYNNGVSTSYGASYTSGDVIGIAFDNTIGTLTFYKNNVSQGAAFTSLSANTYFFAMEGRTGGTPNNVSINFGQRPFTYTAPTGFVALNTFNLPTSTIVKGNTVMDATLYTGNAATRSITNTAGFQPDFVWIKSRSNALNSGLMDSVRGATKLLISNTTNAEQTFTDELTSFNSNGFSLGASTNGYTNFNAYTYVGWQWQAGQGTTSSNTNGSITSTVSVNASAGFSIVTYTGNGTNGATVGHGLGVKPSLIIEKGRASAYNWVVQGCGVLWPTATQTLFLNNTSGLNAGSAIAAPTSSVFTPAALSYANESGLGYVAYCWTPIAGFSAFGSYTGNGSTDGPFVYTGFRPKFVLIKMTSSTGDWYLYDSSRDPYNATQQGLSPNSSASETTYTGWGDLLSNGFKIRRTDAAWNSSGGTYIYVCFSENPFKNALAR